MQLLRVKKPAQVADAVLDLASGQHVRLIQHDGKHFGVTGQGDQEAPVHGRIGVLLRIKDPHHQVRQADDAVDPIGGITHDRVVVGHVQQHEPGQ